MPRSSLPRPAGSRRCRSAVHPRQAPHRPGAGRAGDRASSSRDGATSAAQRFPEARRAPLSGDLDRHGRRRTLEIADGRVARARIAVGACSPVPQRLPALEARWSARRSTRARQIASRPQHLAPLTPIDDIRGTAAYRSDARRRRCCAAAAASGLRVVTRSPLRPSNAHGQRPRASASAGHAARRRRCATSSASPAPRSAATPATAAPARCCSTARQVCACLVADRARPRARGRDGRGPGRRNGALTRCSESFLAHGAAQCGICTPGMLMAASDLLRRNASPSARRGRGCARRRALPLHRLSQDRRGRAGCRRRRPRRVGGSRAAGAAVGARLAAGRRRRPR